MKSFKRYYENYETVCNILIGLLSITGVYLTLCAISWVAELWFPGVFQLGPDTTDRMGLFFIGRPFLVAVGIFFVAVAGIILGGVSCLVGEGIVTLTRSLKRKMDSRPPKSVRGYPPRED